MISVFDGKALKRKERIDQDYIWFQFRKEFVQGFTSNERAKMRCAALFSRYSLQNTKELISLSSDERSGTGKPGITYSMIACLKTKRKFIGRKDVSGF